jgi:hypothetical protein
MEAVGRAEPRDSLKHRRSVDTVMEKKIEDAGINGDSVVLGAIAQVDRNFDCLP